MFTVEFSHGMYGTDTLLTLKRDGVTIARRDPFHNGIPVNKAARQAKIRQVSRQMIKQAEASHGNQ